VFQKAEILVVGRSRDAISGVVGLLEGQMGLSLTSRVATNGHIELWQQHEPSPHALIVSVGEDWEATLPGLLDALPANRPPFLVACPISDIELLKVAMRAGARDAVSPPYDAEGLAARLIELAQEGQAGRPHKSASLVAFLNSKGGSGGSFLAANTAVAKAQKPAHATMLMDLDVQFASLPTYLNMPAGNGLIRALESAETLDAAAIAGYAQKTGNGLHLLSAAMNGLISPEDIAEQRIGLLLDVLDEAYDDIIVDLPRRIDRISGAVLERIDRIALVSQQSITHLQDTKRMVTIMRDYLGISSDRILIVLNRFDKKSEVRQADFAESFPGVDIFTVPSDYRRVAESINLGVPLVEGAAGSSLGRSLTALAERVSPSVPVDAGQSRGILGWLGLGARQ
jgi:pilus assembly protein CpaE